MEFQYHTFAGGASPVPAHSPVFPADAVYGHMSQALPFPSATMMAGPVVDPGHVGQRDVGLPRGRQEPNPTTPPRSGIQNAVDHSERHSHRSRRNDAYATNSDEFAAYGAMGGSANNTSTPPPSAIKSGTGVTAEEAIQAQEAAPPTLADTTLLSDC